jgi:hypothetical protein
MKESEVVVAHRMIFRYLAPVVITASLLGNILTFAVFSRKCFKKKSIGFYTRALAIVDSLCSFLFLRHVLRRGYGMNVGLLGAFLCKTNTFAITVAAASSAHLLVVISLDRMMTILYPQRFDFIKSTYFQLVVVIAISIFNIGYYAPLVAFFELTESSVDEEHSEINSTINTNFSIDVSNQSDQQSLLCATSNEYTETVYNWMDLFNSTLVPFFLMIVFTVIMLVKIFHSRVRSTSSRGSNSSASNIKKKDINFAFVSISLNVIFLILNLPIIVFGLITSQLSDDAIYILNIITINLFYINFGSLFVINFCVNHIFKREVLGTFKVDYLTDNTFNNTK